MSEKIKTKWFLPCYKIKTYLDFFFGGFERKKDLAQCCSCPDYLTCKKAGKPIKATFRYTIEREVVG